jgi:hypothetical protein
MLSAQLAKLARLFKFSNSDKVITVNDEMDSVKKVMSSHCKHLNFDQKLANRVILYLTNFTHKNSEHTEFFGGNTLGVQVVRFTPSDRDKWFEDILDVSEMMLEDDLHQLDDIDSSRVISSDVMNISLFWLAHEFLNSNKVKDDDREEVLTAIFFIMQAKFITSMLAHFFKYPAQKAVADATYARLNYKYGIRQYGSWNALFTAKAKEVFSKDSIHYNTLKKLDDDERVVYSLNNLQGAVKDIVKNIYSVYMSVIADGEKIHSSSSVISHDGAEMVKDVKNKNTAYINYLNSIVTDKDSFIKTELTDIIIDIISTMSPRLFLDSLTWISSNFRTAKSLDLETLAKDILLYSFRYITENPELIKNSNDIPGLLGRLKGTYMSSRSTDEELLSCRERLEAVIRKATPAKNDATVASIRTGVMLYLVLRTITMRHYTNLHVRANLNEKRK